ncbi:enoyl-CoA hydratase/isomerase family protein [Agromyces atrinae]|uniref:enoyl-CoA hydratase/isomerase family protein n=1 Tax=Agromyces atrinae TaxID=592376 RepID=UPI001F55B114|nr:enoyl-CoA hydratase/isomerase family protein [Agromyces atrinae]MCI2956995.1 enoyl-CoA hydratase/isomerase family protein [Agromyces atrinae]
MSVLASVSDGVGHLTLDRPDALNALTLDMVRELAASLDDWRSDAEVALVVLDGAGDRGFCAGGDIRNLYGLVSTGQGDEAVHFFEEEYRLDAAIHEFPKPVVALMDGVTMGGGVGLAGHASIRIVTERSRVAMPETRIGFTPDVGGSWLLGRAPGRIGEYLALTSATMTGADAIYAGFADYFLESDRLPHLRRALAERADPGSPSEIVLLFDDTPGPSELEANRSWIDEAFSGDTVADILDRLRALGTEAALAALAEIEKNSPTALVVSLASVRAARELPDLRAALEQELRLVTWFFEQPDLAEGIRAQVIDKDRTPRWNPATLAEVAPTTADSALHHDVPTALWP